MNYQETYYIYRHIRKDKNEPFYVGKGTINSESTGFRTRYYRAYFKWDRSELWNKIVAKTDYDVEIIFESSDHSLILEKETEFIKMYGRIDRGTGTLANFTDGGEKGNNRTLCRHRGGFKVFAYTIDGNFVKEFPNYNQCAKALGVQPPGIRAILNPKTGDKSAGGYTFTKDYQGEKRNKVRFFQGKSIAQIDKLGNIIKEFRTIRETCKTFKIGKLSLLHCCNTGETHAFGLNFKFIL